MGQIDVELPQLDLVQQEVFDHIQTPGSRAVIPWARRRGKSKLLHIAGIHTAIDGGISWWVNPSIPMARGTWRLLRKHGHILRKGFEGVDVREVERVLHFKHSGGEVQIRSGDKPESLQADALDLAMLDEAGTLSHRCWSILEPTLLDRNGAAIFAGTPKGKDALLYPASIRGDNRVGQWRTWHQTMFDSPHLTDAQKEDYQARYERGEISEHTWQQEFLAVFLDDAGGVFRRVRKAATARSLEGPEEGRKYFVGCDWGRHHDLTWFVVISDEMEVVHFDRMVEIDYTLQIARLKALAEHWKPVEIMAEANAMGNPIVELLQYQGLPVEPWHATNATNKHAVENLAQYFEREEIRIPDDPILIEQLQSYERRRLPSGVFRYAAPEGLHDDGVDALKLAALAATSTGWCEFIC